MDELLKIAAKLGSSKQSSGGGGEPRPSPSEGEPEEDGKDPNGKKEQEGKKDPLKDNKPGDGDPDSPEHSEKKPEGQKDPPKSEKRRPAEPDLKGIFLAKLPDKVREAVLNGDFDQVPEKYRELVREWTKALSEKDKEESGK